MRKTAKKPTKAKTTVKKKTVKRYKPPAKRPTRAQMVKAIEGSHGIITRVNEALNCDWTTAKRWIDEDEEFKNLFAVQREVFVDKAENAIDRQIDSYDERIAHQATKFVLQTLGRSRGYSEKVEIEHSGSMLHKFAEMSKEELIAYRTKILKQIKESQIG